MTEGRALMLTHARNYLATSRQYREAGFPDSATAWLIMAGTLRRCAFQRVPYVHSEIKVCTGCMVAKEHAEDVTTADEPEPWALWTTNEFDIMSGGEHSELCAPEDREAGCDCHHDSWGTSHCEGCGNYMHGDRYTYTVFYRN
jgi:hypothetical protein